MSFLINQILTIMEITIRILYSFLNKNINIIIDTIAMETLQVHKLSSFEYTFSKNKWLKMIQKNILVRKQNQIKY